MIEELYSLPGNNEESNIIQREDEKPSNIEKNIRNLLECPVCMGK